MYLVSSMYVQYISVFTAFEIQASIDWFIINMPTNELKYTMKNRRIDLGWPLGSVMLLQEMITKSDLTKEGNQVKRLSVLHLTTKRWLTFSDSLPNLFWFKC